MSDLPPRPTDPVALCEYEQALALAYEGPDALGALHGYVDNAVERAIIEDGFVVPEMEKPTSNYASFLERHCHPLQLDVIDRALVLWSNPDEVVLTPYMGVGSEVYCAVKAGRKAIGAELKATYYRQACANIAAGLAAPDEEQQKLEFHDADAVEPELIEEPL